MRAKAEGVHDLFAFLTKDANAVVAPTHPKAMPVILTTEDECNHWMTAPVPEALQLQRSLSDDLLRVVSVGPRQDGLQQGAADPASAEQAANLLL